MIQKAVIAESIDYLVAHYQERPDLAFLAKRAGYEHTHFQKLFKEYVGISPKRLCQFMHMKSVRELLQSGDDLLSVSNAAGFSSASRLHDLCVTCEAMSPAQLAQKGRGLNIRFAFAPSVFGEMLIGTTEKGICWLSFVVDERKEDAVNALKARFPNAVFEEGGDDVASLGQDVFNVWQGRGRLNLDVRGTNFQIQVWQALLNIPYGQTVTYSDIGSDIGRPKASRAVGNAVGANPVALLIPCHRVIRASGIIDNYAWGSARKKLLLGYENT